MGAEEPTIKRTEIIQREPAHALAGLLQVDDPTTAADPRLPLPWHWIYLLDRPARADTGRDGHPVRETLPQPPGPGRRRMWAGGRIETNGLLRFGVPTTRRSSVRRSVEKEGRSGSLTFVTISHQYLQDGAVVIEEEQDVLYRPDDGASASTTPAAPPRTDGLQPAPAAGGDWIIPVDPPFLFRYSALTYNGHRIHYDRDYARDVEGYPGLLVHGPLQATCMVEAARAQGMTADHVRLEYRLVAPLYDHQGMVARADRDDTTYHTSIRDLAGRTTAEGTLMLL